MRLRIRERVVICWMVAAMLCLVSGLTAETVYMKDGRVIEGKILNQSRTAVQIQTGAGPLILSKNDILRIQFGPGVQEQKAAEEQRRLEKQNRLEEERKAAEERKLAEERKVAEERKAVEERERSLREDAALKRNRTDLTFSLGGGRRRLVTELYEKDAARRMSSSGWFPATTEWNPAEWGPTLGISAIRNSWRFEGGAFYRGTHADFNRLTAQDESKSLMGKTQPPKLRVGMWNGSGSLGGGHLAGEREFFRSDRGGLGIRLGADVFKEQSTIRATEAQVYDPQSQGVPAIEKLRVPNHAILASTVQLARLDVRWHRYALAGGEAVLSLGWVQGKSISTTKETRIDYSFSNGLPDIIGWNTRLTGRVGGPALQVEYSRPFSGPWQYVISVEGQRLTYVPGDVGGLVTSLSGGGNGGGPPVIPASVMSSLPAWLAARPLHPAVIEMSLGIRRSLGG